MGGDDSKSPGMMEIAVFVGALVAGTGCSLTSKVLLSMEAVGSSGEIEPFSNPLFQTLGMFVGMCMALPVYWIHSAMNRRKAGYESIQDSGAAPPPAVTWSTILALAIPSLFDLAATALCMFGLGYVSVSVYQMLRGGAIVFVAILKHTYLGDKLASFQWAGVALIAISIVLVGASAGGGDDASGDKNPLVGVGLILMGALVQSLQYAFEEKMMSSEIGAPPLLVIGMEGFWGSLVCVLGVYPVMMVAGIEDPYDTYVMMSNSAEIRSMFLAYFLFIFLYNLLAVLVTFMLNSVWHAILDNFRPITVWGTDLFIFYMITDTFGEAWVMPGSGVQLVGLFVLLYGTAVYNGSVPSPFGGARGDALLAEKAAVPDALKSPQMMRSPLVSGAIAERIRANSDMRDKPLARPAEV